jgi:hypothetical protein
MSGLQNGGHGHRLTEDKIPVTKRSQRPSNGKKAAYVGGGLAAGAAAGAALALPLRKPIRNVAIMRAARKQAVGKSVLTGAYRGGKNALRQVFGPGTLKSDMEHALSSESLATKHGINAKRHGEYGDIYRNRGKKAESAAQYKAARTSSGTKKEFQTASIADQTKILGDANKYRRNTAIGGLGLGIGVGTGATLASKPGYTYATNKWKGGKADVEKAQRYYDPEHRRQRRMGMEETGLLTAGAGLGYLGGKNVAQTSRNAGWHIREALKTKPREMKRLGIKSKRVIAASPKGLGYLAGAATAVAGAGAVNYQGNHRHGRNWR